MKDGKWTEFLPLGIACVVGFGLSVCLVAFAEKFDDVPAPGQNTKLDTVLVMGMGTSHGDMHMTGVSKTGEKVYHYEYIPQCKNIPNPGDTIVMDLQNQKSKIVENLTQNRIANQFVKGR